MDNLIEHFDSFISPAIKAEDLAFIPNDSGYAHFLSKYNGGYFFQGALHLYGFDASKDWHDALLINAMVQKAYEPFSFSKTIYCFGCDLFFNQYGFFEGNVVMLEIYSGELTVLASSFDEWVALLAHEGDFYSGYSLLEKWTKERERLEKGERLAATIPFVVGGEYKIENLHLLRQDKLMAFAAFFANEIKDLPDGSNILLKTK